MGTWFTGIETFEYSASSQFLQWPAGTTNTVTKGADRTCSDTASECFSRGPYSGHQCGKYGPQELHFEAALVLFHISSQNVNNTVADIWLGFKIFIKTRILNLLLGGPWVVPGGPAWGLEKLPKTTPLNISPIGCT